MPQTEQQLTDFIKNITQNLLKGNFSSKRIGDTPTDALQLANKKYVDAKSATVHVGGVNADGSTIFLPSGWSCSSGGGTYTFTHTLGTANYTVVGCIGNGLGFSAVVSTLSTSFEIDTWDKTGAATTRPVNFIVALNN